MRQPTYAHVFVLLCCLWYTWTFAGFLKFPDAVKQHVSSKATVIFPPQTITSTDINLLIHLSDIWLMSEINRQLFSFHLDENALSRIYDRGFETIHSINVFLQDLSSPSCHRFYFHDVFGVKLKSKFARIYVKSIMDRTS